MLHNCGNRIIALGTCLCALQSPTSHGVYYGGDSKKGYLPCTVKLYGDWLSFTPEHSRYEPNLHFLMKGGGGLTFVPAAGSHPIIVQADKTVEELRKEFPWNGSSFRSNRARVTLFIFQASGTHLRARFQGVMHQGGNAVYLEGSEEGIMPLREAQDIVHTLLDIRFDKK